VRNVATWVAENPNRSRRTIVRACAGRVQSTCAKYTTPKRTARFRAARVVKGWSRAIRWITANPAWALGLEAETGTLEAGRKADVVVWSADPFSVYAKAELVFNEGWLAFDRNDPAHQLRTDFNLGQAAPGVGR